MLQLWKRRSPRSEILHGVPRTAVGQLSGVRLRNYARREVLRGVRG